MEYKFNVKFKEGKNESTHKGSFLIKAFPDNCGYQIMSYIILQGDKNLFSKEEKTFIAQNLQRFVMRNCHSKKTILTALVNEQMAFSTIDFIQHNELLIGTEVTGSHKLEDSTVCAEFDSWSLTRKLRPVSVKLLEGASFHCKKDPNFW